MGVVKTTVSDGDKINFPENGDLVTVHYDGTLEEDGKVRSFDSSYDRGVPFTTAIGVGKVIRGWDEAVTQMSLGEKAILNITSDFGYGDRGFPGSIPPKTDLVFQVELLKIERVSSTSPDSKILLEREPRSI